jgi:hemolysin activation/secretion protein
MKTVAARAPRWLAARLLTALAATVLAGGAHAQAVPPAPSTVVSPLPHIAPAAPALPTGAVPNLGPQGAEAPLPAVSVAVRSVAIAGATAFAPERLAALTAGLAGNTVPLTQIEAARLALVNLYRGNGYVLSTVSLDIDAAGNIRFIVTEGYIASVKLSRNIGPAGSMVLDFLDHLTQQRPISEAALERWLLLAQQIPGISVHAVLQADGDDPGALTLIAEVSKQSVSALATADDRGFRDTGPTEALAVADLNSVTAHGDQTEVSLFHTSGGTDNFGQASESFYIGDDGLRLKIFGGAGRAFPGGALRDVGYESALTVFGAQVSYPAILRRNQALTLNLRLDATDSIIYTGDGDTRSSSDDLRVARISADYALDDLLAGPSRDALNILDAQISQGIPAFGASPDGRPAGVAGRAGEHTDFWKLNGSIGRTQTLVSPYPDASLALRLEAGGQYTPFILPSEEEFYLGGSRFTRGFYSGQVVGDDAAYATAELEFNTGYDFTALTHDVDLGVQLYAFYDWGEVWENLHTDLNHRIATAGGGIRFGLTRFLELDGEVDERLTTRLLPASSDTLPLSETVIYWGVLARY